MTGDTNGSDGPLRLRAALDELDWSQGIYRDRLAAAFASRPDLAAAMRALPAGGPFSSPAAVFELVHPLPTGAAPEPGAPAAATEAPPVEDGEEDTETSDGGVASRLDRLAAVADRVEDAVEDAVEAAMTRALGEERAQAVLDRLDDVEDRIEDALEHAAGAVAARVKATVAPRSSDDGQRLRHQEIAPDARIFLATEAERGRRRRAALVAAGAGTASGFNRWLIRRAVGVDIPLLGPKRIRPAILGLGIAATLGSIYLGDED